MIYLSQVTARRWSLAMKGLHWLFFQGQQTDDSASKVGHYLQCKLGPVACPKTTIDRIEEVTEEVGV
jgi:hypothetical protein